MHLFMLTKPPRENWFHYVRREYATAINFPCLITLGLKMNKWDRICLVYLTDTVVNQTCQV